jgi:hypothetical protein
LRKTKPINYKEDEEMNYNNLMVIARKTNTLLKNQQQTTMQIQNHQQKSAKQLPEKLKR